MENIEDIYELSPMQEGLLFHTLYEPDSSVYFEQLNHLMYGKIDIPAFERAWQQVVDRHPILRTSFHWDDIEKPLQVVHRQVKLPFEWQDWRRLYAAEQEERFDAYLKADRVRGFKLQEAPLMRLALLQLTEESFYVVWSFHHILLDGWCLQLIIKEHSVFYEAACLGQDVRLEPVRPYRDYITWLQQRDLSAAEAFWRRTLLGFNAPTPLVVDHAAEPVLDPDDTYGERHAWLSRATTSALQTLARQHQLTVNTLVQGAWALLLNRYSAAEDVVFGATTSGRGAPLPGIETMVGLFLNTLPVRVQVSPQAELLPWLQELQARQFEARQYDYSPLVQVQEWSEVPRGMPLFKSILGFENYPMEGIRVRIMEVRSWNLAIRKK